MADLEYLSIQGTRTRQLQSARLLAGGRIHGLSVAAWYPTEMGKADAAPLSEPEVEPGLEERADRWLEEHREAMKRLAER